MRTNLLLVMTACGGAMFTANQASAQDVVVEEQSLTVVEAPACKDHYYSTCRDNWFIQLGAGIQSYFGEKYAIPDNSGHSITTTYNVAFGKWVSPYIGWRLGFNYGALHWESKGFNKLKTVNANLDMMWDMFNSLGNTNPQRVFSIVPFIGLGGAYNWDFRSHATNIIAKDGKLKSSVWTLPVSAGLDLRFRLSKYVNFFAEGRVLFVPDAYNLTAYGEPIEMNIQCIGGFQFKIGGDNFKTYNPCADAAYIAGLNAQVNDLRAEVAATAAALAAAEAQLPCPPQQVVADCPEVEATPMLTTVRFTINSAKISDEEMVNVYNVAEYLKANPDAKVAIQGYADKDTGTAAYNKSLSERRAQAVKDALTKTYGIDAGRLATAAEGSEVQPYSTNNWNRIVIFAPDK